MIVPGPDGRGCVGDNTGANDGVVDIRCTGNAVLVGADGRVVGIVDGAFIISVLLAL